MEVIAERKKHAGGIFVACIVTGALCFALIAVIGVFYALGEAEIEALLCGGIMLLIVGAGFLVAGILLLRRLRSMPSRIVLEGRNIDFGNRLICTADKIEDITFYEYKNRHYRTHRFSYGNLTVCVDGTKIVYEFIANVEQAYNRLTELMEQAKNK